MIRIFYFLPVIPILLLFSNCATVSAPIGGPKDESPPALVETTVENGSTNFNSNTISLTFNEFIKLDNPTQNVYSSPPLGSSVSFVVRKDKLFIIFKEDLEENTTYHLNFGNSIRDINEGNPLSNFNLVFATGDAVDSLSYQGTIQSINNAEITETTLIGLYRTDTTDGEYGDSAFLKGPPYYFTFVDKNGSYVLEYLKAGSYRVFALTDRNNNFYYDLPNEAIGFLDSVLVLEKKLLLAEVPLFIPEAGEMRVQSFTNTISEYKVDYELSSSIPANESLMATAFNETDTLPTFSLLSADRKKLTCWIGPELKGLRSIRTVLFQNGTALDTFQHTVAQLKFPKPEITFSSQELTPSDSLIFSLSSPMSTPCLDIAITDTLNRDTLRFIAYKYSDYQFVVKFNGLVQAGIVYTLLTADSCFTNIYGQAATIKDRNLRIVPQEDRAILRLLFNGIKPETDYLVTLQDSNKKTMASWKINDEANQRLIEGLRPGNYFLQIIEDTNRNGVWNSGSIIPRRLPEKIYTYPKDFTLRPNWELEETINLTLP